MDKEIFIEKYSKALHEGYAAVFAGAGISIDAGFIDWKTLVKPFAKRVGLDIDKETDLTKVTQYYQNSERSRGSINQEIINAFSKHDEVTDTVEILTRLPIPTYWTTNYDKVLEKGLERNNRKADIKINETNLANNIYDRDAVIYKMHGDVMSPETAVLTKDDYELYNETHSLFTIALKGDLISKTFLFVGLSFEDPNLDEILSRIKVLLGNNTREHYCFLKKIDRTTYINIDESISESEYLYDEVRQKLRIEDLKRYGIKTVLLDSYDEISTILSQVEKLYLNKTVFISGSISSYYGNWTESIVNNLCYSLSKRLVSEDYKVSSGFGLGIGSSIINGALNEIYRSKFKHLNEHLILNPFPQVSDGEISLKDMWSKYRQSIISESGICIFLFGNKLVDNKVVIADGMKEEFQIAKKLKKIIIPLGGTGGAAKEIFDLIKEESNQYEYLMKYWEKLESTDETTIIDTILNIVNENQN